MAHCNTILSQILKLVPRHEFEALAKQHHSGRALRKASCWSQFVSLTMAQFSWRNSLRDIVDNMSAQMVFGIVIKKNRKTVVVLSEDKRRWKLPPGMLSIVKDI